MRIGNFAKRSQSEAVGFVIIILIVVIASIIFLGVYLRKSRGVVTEDAEIANFLSASQGYTTECYKDNEPFYRELGDLIKDCYQQNTAIVCPENRAVCDVLNSTYSEMLLRFMPAGTLAYYRMSFYYRQSANETEEKLERFGPEIVFGDRKKCTAIRAGRSEMSLAEGILVAELEICRV